MEIQRLRKGVRGRGGVLFPLKGEYEKLIL